MPVVAMIGEIFVQYLSLFGNVIYPTYLRTTISEIVSANLRRL
jgi:hypothetical protein